MIYANIPLRKSKAGFIVTLVFSRALQLKRRLRLLASPASDSQLAA
jgi:hypothetical protein